MKMNRNTKCCLWTGISLLTAFLLWTLLSTRVDVQAIGPKGTVVGFATFNLWFHNLTGVHMTLYTITDWLGLVPIVVCLCFAALGAVQLVKRRSLFKVDRDIILLGVYYILVIFCYLFFEMVPIHYRPILLSAVVEASYPSSPTLLVLSVIPTLKFQIDRRIDKPFARNVTTVFVIAFSMFMVIGRLIAGVHWATDIIGAVLLSFGLFRLYQYFAQLTDLHGEKHGVQ